MSCCKQGCNACIYTSKFNHPQNFKFTDKDENKKIVSAKMVKSIEFGGDSKGEFNFDDNTLEISLKNGEKGPQGIQGIPGKDGIAIPTPKIYNVKGEILPANNLDIIEYDGSANMEIIKEANKIKLTINNGSDGKDIVTLNPKQLIVDGKEYKTENFEKLELNGTAEKMIIESERKITMTINNGIPTPNKYVVDDKEVNANGIDKIIFKGTAKKSIDVDNKIININLNNGTDGTSDFKVGKVVASILEWEPFIIGEWAPLKPSAYKIKLGDGSILSIPFIINKGSLVSDDISNLNKWNDGVVKKHKHDIQGREGLIVSPPDHSTYKYYDYDTPFALMETKYNSSASNYNEPAGLSTIFYVYVGQNAKLDLEINSGNFQQYITELDKLGVKRTQEGGGNTDVYTFRNDALTKYKKYKNEFEARLNKDFPDDEHIFGEDNIKITYLNEYEIFKYIYAFVKY